MIVLAAAVCCAAFRLIKIKILIKRNEKNKINNNSVCGYYNIILRACLYSFIYFSSSTLNVKKNIQDNKITKTHI